MNAAAVLIAMSTLGVHWGHEPLPDGGYEYTIEIEPELLDNLRDGTTEISASEIPSWLSIRRLRVIVGAEKNLPRVMAKPALPMDASAKPAPGARVHDAQPVAASWSDATHGADATPARFEEDADSRSISSRAGKSTESSDRFDRRSTDSRRSTFDAEADAAPRRARVTDEPRRATAIDEPRHVTADEAEEPRPWATFFVTLTLLTLSAGANVYLGWVVWSQRARYWQMVSKLRAEPA